MATTIRGPRGLGDAIYLRPIVDHLVRAGAKLRVFCDYPEVFRGVDVTVEPFIRHPPADIIAHYVGGKETPGTNQFQDMCRAAKIMEPLTQGFNWTVTNHVLVNDLRARAGWRKIILVHGGRTPMDRTDGFGAELLPAKAACDAVLEQLSDCFLVRVGRDGKMGGELYGLRCDIDLQNRTSVSDLLDLGAICDGAVGQCSYIIPLAEAFGKPLLVVWAARGLKAAHGYVRSITPKKVLSGPASRFVFDDVPVEKIKQAAREFSGAMTAAEAVA